MRLPPPRQFSKLQNILEDIIMNKTYYIYKHTNLVNRKVYIGQTYQDPVKRWGNGISAY